MRWLWQRKLVPPVRFVILFPGRTGSSFLVSALASHPQVLVEGEQLVRRDSTRQRDWLRSYLDLPRPPAVHAVGFKTKLKDVADLEGFSHALRSRRVRVLALRRRNLVKLAVSTLNAKRIHDATGRWNLRGSDAALSPLAVQPDDLAHAIEGCAAAQREVDDYTARLGLETLVLEYEDLLADEAAWLDRVARFLGVEPRPLRGTVEKATSDDLRIALADHAMHAARFADTPYAGDFSE